MAPTLPEVWLSTALSTNQHPLPSLTLIPFSSATSSSSGQHHQHQQLTLSDNLYVALTVALSSMCALSCLLQLVVQLTGRLLSSGQQLLYCSHALLGLLSSFSALPAILIVSERNPPVTSLTSSNMATQRSPLDNWRLIRLLLPLSLTAALLHALVQLAGQLRQLLSPSASALSRNTHQRRRQCSTTMKTSGCLAQSRTRLWWILTIAAVWLVSAALSCRIDYSPQHLQLLQNAYIVAAAAGAVMLMTVVWLSRSTAPCVNTYARHQRYGHTPEVTTEDARDRGEMGDSEHTSCIDHTPAATLLVSLKTPPPTAAASHLSQNRQGHRLHRRQQQLWTTSWYLSGVQLLTAVVLCQLFVKLSIQPNGRPSNEPVDSAMMVSSQPTADTFSGHTLSSDPSRPPSQPPPLSKSSITSTTSVETAGTPDPNSLFWQQWWSRVQWLVLAVTASRLALGLAMIACHQTLNEAVLGWLQTHCCCCRGHNLVRPVTIVTTVGVDGSQQATVDIEEQIARREHITDRQDNNSQTTISV